MLEKKHVQVELYLKLGKIMAQEDWSTSLKSWRRSKENEVTSTDSDGESDTEDVFNSHDITCLEELILI